MTKYDDDFYAGMHELERIEVQFYEEAERVNLLLEKLGYDLRFRVTEMPADQFNREIWTLDRKQEAAKPVASGAAGTIQIRSVRNDHDR